jgi:protein ImuB
VLEPDGAQTQRFECSLSRPARTANYLSPLLRLKLEQIRVDAPVRAMSVRAVALERFADEQPNLFDAGSDAALAQLLDSLTTRLGKDAVSAARFVADPLPELACRFESPDSRLASAEKRQDMDAPIVSHRPLRLFARPIPIDVRSGKIPIVPIHDPTRSESCRHDIERFHCSGRDHLVTTCHGPERIETGWWRGADVQRDYYLVETTDGTRWWIFHRLEDGRWFLHGCFD